MGAGGVDVESAFRQLLHESHDARPEDLPEMIGRVAPLLDVTDLVIHVVDHQQRVLVPIMPVKAAQRDVIAVDGTVAGRAFSMVTVQEVPSDDAVTMWIPLLDGTDRQGVLQVVAPVVDDQTRRDCSAVAALLAEMLITRSLYGDMIEQVRRRAAMTVPAELIRSQLPPLTFATGRIVISGLLEPCYDVGGDAFDYAVNGDVAHLALFDAVGHGAGGGMQAAVLASVAVAAYRNARRGDLDLADTYGHVDAVVRAHDRAGLITGIFAELDQISGLLRVISAGHPGGMIIRDGAVVKTLPTPTALPVSMGDLRAPAVVEESLQPGDHVLLYTDGVTEARTEDGEFFGVDRLAAFVVRAVADGLSAPETTRRLVHAILEYQNNVLQDDATILLVQWLADSPPLQL
jgi:hypothetical protein